MKQALIFFIIVAISISSANALSVLSSSQIDFESNNPVYNGPAFVLLGVENGGNDIITWTINNFESQLDDGYDMTRTGTISSDFKAIGWTYPIQSRGASYNVRTVGEVNKFFWPWQQSDAQDWCFNTLGGDVLANTFSTSNFVCIEAYVDGYFFSLRQGEYDYTVDYTLRVDGQGSDTFTLTDTTSVGGKMIGSKNWFQAVRQFDGVSPRSDPDIDDKIWYYFDLRLGSWKTINPDYAVNRLSVSSLKNTYSNCYSWNIIGSWQICMDEWQTFKNSEIVNNRKTESGVSISATVNSQGLGTGSVKFNDGNVYRNPVVTMTINADKVGVIRTFGEGDIVSVDYPRDMVVGETYNIQITTKNVGDASMDASLSFSCNAYSISGIDQRYTLSAGQTKTDSGTIRYTGGVTGCTTGDSCTLNIRNTNSVNNDDTFNFAPKVCQLSECSQEGAKDCFGDIIKECTNVNGVLKFTTVAQCTQLCVDEGYNAFCDDNERPVCGDGICQPSELPGEADACSLDCTIKPPLCGDNICDARERDGGEFECVEDKQDPWDCPAEIIKKDGLSWWAWTLIGLGAFSLLGGAIWIRLKRLGGI